MPINNIPFRGNNVKINNTFMFATLIMLWVVSIAHSQQKSTLRVTTHEDSVKIVNLKEVIIDGDYFKGGIERMPALKDNVIYTGKKTEVILLEKTNADISTNNARQVFAKIPGMSIWENDGSGIQVGVAARGLSPNRSWEFNVRQNGYDISSEAFGYPEAYYTPPMEALERIEVVRGSASLQYGTQFGGLLNYQIKRGNPYKEVSFESLQSVGSYGLFNTYNAIGGTYQKLSYYGFLHHRTADGWRSNSRYNVFTGYLSANYQLTEKINIGAEYTKMDYQSQQAGGLTDLQFVENHRRSYRERNWFGTPWNVASLIFKFTISPMVNIQITSFATIAERNSVGFMQAITVKDTINQNTLDYNARQVDRDSYENYGTEARASMKYELGDSKNILAGGIRAYSGKTNRDQQGVGTTGDEFDLSLTTPQFGRSLKFGTTNYAAFAENIFQFGNLKIVHGGRVEFVRNTVEGYINTSQAGQLLPKITSRQIILYGIGSEFQVSEKTNLYANYSRSFRPVTFSELTPSVTTEIIDSNLSDANGFNVDFGFRGDVEKFLTFDVGIYYLKYNNRIGTLTQNGSPFKTNVGASVSKGIESFIEISPFKFFDNVPNIGNLSIFTSNSFIEAKYVEWNNPAIANDPAKSIVGKRVENAPQYIHRFGATYNVAGLSATFQMSSVGEVFTDAANTENSNASATIGKLSGYQIIDISVSYYFDERYSLKAGINNLTDEKYATRRAGGYPGPGILPGNGKTLYLTVGASL
jgi:Fe(3+) dicitrate transport protein